MNYKETMKEVSQDRFYEVVGEAVDYSIINRFEYQGRGYVSEFYKTHSRATVLGVSESGNFPFTPARYFLAA